MEMTPSRNDGMHWRPRAWIIALATGFSLCVLLWILYFPFRPAQVLRVVPSNAIAATWHHPPLPGVESLLNSAPAVLTLAANDISADNIRHMLDEAGIEKLLTRLGRRGSSISWSPAFGAHGSPALILGAWVGGISTHLMRAGLLNRSFDGYTAHRIGKDRIWIGFFPDMPLGMRYVSFGVYEGVLAGCASSDPFAAVSLLAALRRHGMLSPLVSPWVTSQGALHTHLRELHNMIRIHTRIDEEQPVALTGHFRIHPQGEMEGTLVIEPPRIPTTRLAALWAPYDHSTKEAGVFETSPFPIPGHIPAMLFSTSIERLIAASAVLLPSMRERRLLEHLRKIAETNANVTAWVATGEYAGRVMRMRIPSIGIAMRISTQDTIETLAGHVTDGINTAFGAGLLALPDRQDRRIHVLQPVQDPAGIFSMLKPEERPALAIVNHQWLVAMTHLGTLRKLLDHIPPSRQTPEHPEAFIYGSAHLPDAADAVSGALAAYALARLIQYGRTERRDSPLVKQVLGAMKTLGNTTLHMQHDDHGDLKVTWRMGGRQGGLQHATP